MLWGRVFVGIAVEINKCKQIFRSFVVVSQIYKQFTDTQGLNNIVLFLILNVYPGKRMQSDNIKMLMIVNLKCKPYNPHQFEVVVISSSSLLAAAARAIIEKVKDTRNQPLITNRYPFWCQTGTAFGDLVASSKLTTKKNTKNPHLRMIANPHFKNTFVCTTKCFFSSQEPYYTRRENYHGGVKTCYKAVSEILCCAVRPITLRINTRVCLHYCVLNKYMIIS